MGSPHPTDAYSVPEIATCIPRERSLVAGQPQLQTQRRELRQSLSIRLCAAVLISCQVSIAFAQSEPGRILAAVPGESALFASDETQSVPDVQTQLLELQKQIDALQHAKAVETPLVPPIAAIAKPEPPKYPTVRLTGFFQADAAWFHQDANNRLTIGNGVPANGDIQDGADFRRARLAAVGKVWDNVNYMLEMDFAFPGRPSFMDLWMDIDNAIGSNSLRIGQFRQPFGMDGQTSVKDMTFLERGLPFAFLPFRQIGAMTYGHTQDEQMTWAFSGFRYPVDQFGGNVGDNGGYGMAARVTALLVDSCDDSRLMHVGGGYSFLNPANDAVQYRNQPEFFVGENGAGVVPPGVPAQVPVFVDTGAIPTDNINLFNAELAMSSGSFHAQSEIFYATVQQKGGPRVTYPGAYAQAGYILTGETRAYNRKAGVFGRIKPKRSVGSECGPGAWEVAGRWSYLDLSDSKSLGTGPGGRLNNITGGLNWYLNPYTKLQLNYIHAFLDNPTFGNSDADIVAMRAQIDF